MSEQIRSYFSLRYALPGYTFLTIVLIMNIEFFIGIMPEPSYSIDFFGIILGFLSLLSGSAIGFIVSQPWYSFYNHLKRTNIIKKRRPHQRLNEIIEHIEELIIEPPDRISIMAYVLTYKIPEQITNYINRLNDMVNSLASTISAIITGLITGHIIRGLTFNKWFVWYDCIIWGVLLFFIVLIFYNCYTVYQEHDSIADLMIRIKREELRKEFLKLYMSERNDTEPSCTCEANETLT